MEKPDLPFTNFHQLAKEAPPRSLLMEALEHVPSVGHALDLGASALSDSKFLLSKGFEVTAVDANPLTQDAARELDNDALHVQITKFEDFNFPKDTYELVSSMFSLPFVKEADFTRVMSDVKDSLKSQGVFCGTFFGPKDGWLGRKGMTFVDEEQIRDLFTGFDIISLTEYEEDKQAVGADRIKHWHVFKLIAKKE